MGKSLNHNKAFSLVELSMVLVIVGLLVSGIVVAGASIIATAKLDDTRERLKVIEDAIEAYVKTNGYLPCVARRDLTVGDANYGVALADCTTATTSTFIAAGTDINPTAGTSDDQVHVGGLPIKTLNLPSTLASDAYGSNFTYAVSIQLTTSASNYNTYSGNVSVIDVGTNSIITPSDAAAYAVISHGNDKVGGYNKSSGALFSACSGIASISENCDTDQTFMDDQLNPESTSAYHDDIILWNKKENIPDYTKPKFIGARFKVDDGTPGIDNDDPASGIDITDVVEDTGYNGTSFCNSCTGAGLFTIPQGISVVKLTLIADTASSASNPYCYTNTYTGVNSLAIIDYLDISAAGDQHDRLIKTKFTTYVDTGSGNVSIRLRCRDIADESNLFIEAIACDDGCPLKNGD